MGRLFGTDGVRGVANTELTCALAFKIGQAGAYILASEVHRPKIIIGRDTRISCKMLEAALTAGICSIGGDVILTGVIPTPAMAYLVRQYSADAAVMISASHNSYEYNGIKWFSAKGYKLSDALEDKIEELVKADGMPIDMPSGMNIGSSTKARNAAKEYAEFLSDLSEKTLSGMTIALDCANGAASFIAPELFRSLGATVCETASTPNGCNINDMCGSTKPKQLQNVVTEMGADIGLAFDGDADRLIAVDEFGVVVDGDVMMAIMAKDMLERGTLKRNTLVTTVMSNYGMRLTLQKLGVNIETTDVGDRYVLERMLEGGFNLGGEQSGHIIFLDNNTTGDGLLTAVKLLNVLKKNSAGLSELARTVDIFPQTLINVKVPNEKKNRVMADEGLAADIERVERQFCGRGRVLVRPSGTEPIIRVMLEGEDKTSIDTDALELAKSIETLASK